MAHSDLSSLKQRIADVVQNSAVGGHLKSIDLEEAQAEDGSDFLRVLIHVDSLGGVADDEMEALTASIEDAVDAVDQRFPSVRYSEAA